MLLSVAGLFLSSGVEEADVDRYSVVFNSPSGRSLGAMPLGNGRFVLFTGCSSCSLMVCIQVKCERMGR